MKKSLAAAALACCFAIPAHAVPIFSDNFNSNPADHLNGTPNGWTVTGGIVDIIGSGGAFDWYPGNGSYIDLDGTNGPNGQVSTILSNTIMNFANGLRYNFSFDYGINHNDSGDSDTITLGVLINNTYFQDLITVNADGLNHASSLFTMAAIAPFAPGNFTGQLYIRGNSVGGSDQSGGIVDNISVSAVPLPGAALLLMSGLFGMGGLARMRRKALA
jgi:hypothetical protein